MPNFTLGPCEPASPSEAACATPRAALPPHYKTELLEMAGGLSLGLTAQGYIAYASESACTLLSYPREVLLGTELASLVSQDQVEALQAAWATAQVNPAGSQECFKFLTGDTQPKWFDVVIKRIATDPEPFMAIYGRDVSKWMQASKALEERYLLDPLTGTGNRVAMKAALEQNFEHAKSTGTSFALAMLDLDGFKKINDTYGHDVGDALLQAAAARLKRSIRPSDIVVRMGGDEFVVLFHAVPDLETGKALAERVVTAFQQPFHLQGKHLHVTTSLGLVVLDCPDINDAELLKRADLAMYDAKENGKNQVSVYSPELERRTQVQVETEQRMYEAVEAGEFHLQYQPIFHPVTKQVHSVEALMRWTAPSGPIAPDYFIPLAEQNGLIHLLGQWAIRCACAQLVKWERAGCSVPSIAVNISPVQLANARFVANIKAAVQESGVSPSRLVLEITEGALMADPTHSAKVLAELRALGFTFAVDDFGTGYSSLAYLKRFPLTSLKIDRSFITDMQTCPHSKTIVFAVLSLANALGLRVVAEGVETLAQCQTLAVQGCTYAQGWLVSPALTPDELVKKVKAGELVLGGGPY